MSLNLKKSLEKKVKELQSFRTRFKMNNSRVQILMNKNLLDMNKFIIIIEIDSIEKYFVSINEISKFINFDESLDEKYEKGFKFKILENILVDKKLDKFWENAINSINRTYEKIEINYKNIVANKKIKVNKKLGCFVYCIKRLPSNYQMTDKQFDHLVSLGLEKNYINEIKKKGLTIGTTWDNKKANRDLYFRLKNKQI